MTTRRPSRRSATPSHSRESPQPDGHVYYVDECLEAGELVRKLADLSASFETATTKGWRAVEDAVWIRKIGSSGMVLLSRDTRIRNRPVELQAIYDSRVRSFFLTGAKDLSGQQIAEIVELNMKRIGNLAREHRGPFVARVSKSGVEITYGKKELADIVSGRQAIRELKAAGAPRPHSA